MGKGEGSGEGSGMGSFLNGTFGCLGHWFNCLCGTFCFPCQVCQNANRLHENCCLYGCLSIFCPCIAVSMLRTQVRDKYNISGTTLEDCCCGWCCTPCVSCQTANEIETRLGAQY